VNSFYFYVSKTHVYTQHCQVGLEAARTLDDKACWEKLADAALAQGNHQVCICAHRCKLTEILST